MIYGELSCSQIFFFIFNNCKITELKGLYDEKKQKLCKSRNCETYKIQKLTYIADFQFLINGFYRNSLMY